MVGGVSRIFKEDGGTRNCQVVIRFCLRNSKSGRRFAADVACDFEAQSETAFSYPFSAYLSPESFVGNVRKSPVGIGVVSIGADCWKWWEPDSRLNSWWIVYRRYGWYWTVAQLIATLSWFCTILSTIHRQFGGISRWILTELRLSTDIYRETVFVAQKLLISGGYHRLSIVNSWI